MVLSQLKIEKITLIIVDLCLLKAKSMELVMCIWEEPKVPIQG